MTLPAQENSTLARPSEKETQVVYGVYDSRTQPLSVRIHDFFVDRQKIKIKEKSYFFHLLAVMIDAGIPIVRALKVLSKRSENERFSRIINTMAYDVERGKKMSQSMTKFPDIFKEAEIGVVRSGEAIGNLHTLLFKLAEQTGRSHELLMKVRGALVYPITVLIALSIAGIIVVTMVLPQLRGFFEQSGVEMPFLTKVVLGAGEFIIRTGWTLLSVLVLLILVLSIYLRSASGRRRFDTFLLSVGWVKEVVRKVNIANFVQLLSLLVSAGVPIHEGIGIASGAMNNVLYQDFLRELKTRVEQGEKIADNLEKAPFLFPETVSTMISVGENTGALSQVSEKLALHYEKEVAQSLENFTTILEPVVIVFVGLAVGIMALAILGPIFSLSTLVT